MTVAIIAGLEGTGKTSQVLEIGKEFGPTVWGILELKDVEELTEMKSSTFRPERLYQVYDDGTELQGNVDPVKTLESVRKWRDEIYALKPLPRTIVIDGISELRDYAIDEWIIRYNAKNGKTRQSIGEKDLGAWGEVNGAVKKILEPLINKALLQHVNFVMTAGMKEKYVDGHIVGYTPDYKAWMARSVQCLVQLSCANEAYNLKCLKEPKNPRWSVDRIKKKTGLLDALRGHNLIEAALNNYVIRYEEDGEIARTFIKSQTEETAREEFAEKSPNAVIIEVMK